MANTYIPLSSTTLTASASTITISSIPQTYTDLLIKTSMRSTYPGVNVNWTTIRWNNDGSQLYSSLHLFGTGSTTNRQYPYYITGDLATASTFANGEIYISDYSSSTSKAITATGFAENNDANNNSITITAATYTGTSGISSIVFFPNGGTFDIGCKIDVYGIKNS